MRLGMALFWLSVAEELRFLLEQSAVTRND
jgi:hypothetical protein